jgi:3'(2'), 5'-bisphosphate nucleotidase/myo-inositol-1(or 4)-monophosphatase
MSEIIEELSKVVKTIGYNLLEWRDCNFANGEWKGTQFKSQADFLAHDLLVHDLRCITPGIPIISEEDSNSWLDTRPDCYWLIDPIDGTASFAQGYSGFVTQAALVVRGDPHLAAVYAPVSDSLYVAEREKGAFLNEKRLHCMQEQDINTLIDNYPEPRGVTLLAYRALGIQNYIECGSISLKICKVADNSADLFFKDVIVRDWDLAAPQVILEEADGKLTDIHGHRITYTDSYKKAGLVAACSHRIAMRLVSWYVSITESERIE